MVLLGEAAEGLFNLIIRRAARYSQYLIIISFVCGHQLVLYRQKQGAILIRATGFNTDLTSQTLNRFIYKLTVSKTYDKCAICPFRRLSLTGMGELRYPLSPCQRRQDYFANDVITAIDIGMVAMSIGTPEESTLHPLAQIVLMLTQFLLIQKATLAGIGLFRDEHVYSYRGALCRSTSGESEREEYSRSSDYSSCRCCIPASTQDCNQSPGSRCLQLPAAQ